MVHVSIGKRTVTFEVLGLHKVWALKSRLVVPLVHIRGVRVDPTMTPDRCSGWRMPGTYVRGRIAAGTYYDRGRRVFWDVGRSRRSIVVELSGELYDELVVEVADPHDAVEQLRAALPAGNVRES